MELEEITYKIYSFFTDIFSKIGGRKRFVFWLLLLFLVLLVISIYWPIHISKETLGLVFRIIPTILITSTVFAGTVFITEARNAQNDLKKLKEIAEVMLKFSIYNFFVIILNLIFITLANTFSQYNIGLPFLVLTISLTAYSFYLVLKRISSLLF